MRKLCVIGDPIEHSKSPIIQNAMIRAAGLDYVYDARRVEGADTALWLKQAKKEHSFINTGEKAEHPFFRLEQRCGSLYGLFATEAPGAPDAEDKSRIYYHK